MPLDPSGAPEIERLVTALAKLPGLGQRSARRAVLHLITHRDTLLRPLAQVMNQTADVIVTCGTCGTIDTKDPCTVCRDARREQNVLCVVEQVSDLWALERAGAFSGRYHVLGGTLSALDGITPDDLNIEPLIARARAAEIQEVIIALDATVDGQTTAHYLTDRLADAGVTVSRLAHGVPVGGELEYLDEGTLTAALKARRPM